MPVFCVGVFEQGRFTKCSSQPFSLGGVSPGTSAARIRLRYGLDPAQCWSGWAQLWARCDLLLSQAGRSPLRSSWRLPKSFFCPCRQSSVLHPLSGKESHASKASGMLQCFRAWIRPVPSFAGGGGYTAHLRDASDFHEWLLEASKKAAQSRSVEEFFSCLRHGA